ncbi:MAG: DUF3267 domain-containing protein [Clostridiales Family XIII bacterium]|jgi:hypothetical protein|nr:DUF3267 domain-containing protein [Clostridiales Family XIII bacterium]
MWNSEKEQAAYKKYADTRTVYANNGYNIVEVSVSMLKANVFGMIAAIAIAYIFHAVYYHLFPLDQSAYTSTPLMLMLLLASIVIHELLHGVFFSMFTSGTWRDKIHFGINKISPYCSCTKPISAVGYACAGLAPFAILGMGMFVLSIQINSRYLFMLSLYNILFCSGDLFMIALLLKHRPKEILDHPSRYGFYILKRKT